MGWIKCTDEMPPKDGRYLVIHEFSFGRRVEVLNYAKKLCDVDYYDFPEHNYNHPGWYNLDSETGYYEVCHVSYWQDLPSLPKEDR